MGRFIQGWIRARERQNNKLRATNEEVRLEDKGSKFWKGRLR